LPSQRTFEMPCQGYSDALLASVGLVATADDHRALFIRGGARVSMPNFMVSRGLQPDLTGGGGAAAGAAGAAGGGGASGAVAGGGGGGDGGAGAGAGAGQRVLTAAAKLAEHASGFAGFLGDIVGGPLNGIRRKPQPKPVRVLLVALVG
jgi:hypothetical protein